MLFAVDISMGQPRASIVYQQRQWPIVLGYYNFNESIIL
jgi:hypothetical protein